MSYVVPDLSTVESVVAADEQVQEWQEVYDQGYLEVTDRDFGEDFNLWVSSYTGEPIPIEQMRAWRDAAVERILSFAPQRVLELGVGTGLLLARIAGGVEAYWATDFSEPVIERLGRQVAAAGWAQRVRLLCRRADDLSGIPQDFDTVVLNSVVQYFPNERYLERVLDSAWTTLAPAVVSSWATFGGLARYAPSRWPSSGPSTATSRQTSCAARWNRPSCWRRSWSSTRNGSTGGPNGWAQPAWTCASRPAVSTTS